MNFKQFLTFSLVSLSLISIAVLPLEAQVHSSLSRAIISKCSSSCKTKKSLNKHGKKSSSQTHLTKKHKPHKVVKLAAKVIKHKSSKKLNSAKNAGLKSKSKKTSSVKKAGLKSKSRSCSNGMCNLR